MTVRRKSSTRRPRFSASSRSQPIAGSSVTATTTFNEPPHQAATGAPPTSPARPKSISPNEPTTPARRLRLQSLKNTPVKFGSHSNGPTTSSASTATHAQTRQSEPAAPAPMTQAQLDINIESEMHNAIFHDPEFVEHFLNGDSTALDAVLADCRQSEAYNAGDEQWRLPSHISSEAVLYPPILRILNAIKHSVDKVKARPPGSDLGSSQTEQASHLFSDDDPDNVPLQPGFRDRHSRAVDSDEVETAGLKPDIVLFDTPGIEHWETLRMSIEIKKLPTHHKAAMKQLSRYARATFAHQLHRRHLFGLTICGTEATFVLFDRAGILYSPRIDIRSQFEEFTKAFASLLLLDRTDEGYDPAFETEVNEEDRLKYYVNLPLSVFEDSLAPTASASGDPDSPAGGTRKFEVVDRLCHRKSIRGRATIVLRLREVRGCHRSYKMETRSQAHEKTQSQEKAQGKAPATGKRKRDQTEEPQVRDFVLKIIWRDPGRDSEGEVMEHFKGMFGLAQHVWHSDVPGRCRCSPPADGQCWAPSCVATTAQWEKMEVCDNLRDIVISVPMDDENIQEKDLVEVDTTRHRPASSTRKRRICSYILLSSIGVLLSEANDPAEFMNAVLDAILGYWRLFNMGILHRDISEGNVMILDRERPEGAGDGETNQVRRELPEEPWLAAMRAQEPLLVESEYMLQQFLARVRRSPTGMLSDFDLHAKHTLLAPWSTTHDIQNYTAEASTGNSGRSTSSPVEIVSETMPPEGKRRRTNSRRSLPVSSRPSQATSGASTARPELPSYAQDHQDCKIDFRTGTPAFMSIRVSSTLPGTPYHHSYLDDLESFFWLILWSAAAHLDEESQHTSSKAQHVLNTMSTGTFESIVDFKRCRLRDCQSRGGVDMRAALQLYQNSWAAHPIFTNVILGLGRLFHQVDEWEIPEDEPPASMFPRVVSVIMDALRIM